MKDAKQLILDFTAFSFEDPATAAAMFAENGAIEIPYLSIFGLPTRYEGHQALIDLFKTVRDLYPGFKFQNLQIVFDMPTQAFAEYELIAKSSKTGRSVRNLFSARLVAENGKIKLLREFLNAAEIARAILPRGIPDLPDN
jgi:ketosteroid isomerase-like protein